MAADELEGVSLRLIETPDDVADFQRWLGERRPVLAIDTETTGLDWWAPDFRCRLFQMADTMSGWAMSWRDWRGLGLWALKAYEGDIVGHNWAYDAHVLSMDAGKGLELPWHRTHDTMLQHAILEPNGWHGLKNIAMRRFGRAAVAGQDLLKQLMAQNGWDWATVPVDVPAYWAYGALDGVLTARLDEEQQGKIQERALANVYSMERAVQRILWNMEARGFRIDRALCAETRASCEASAESIASWIRSTYGIGVGSPKQLAQLLVDMGAMPLEEWPRTKSGALAVDDAALTDVLGHAAEREDVRALVTQVREYRRNAKLAGTYLSNILERLDGNDRLHASIKQLGARTGRMSVAQPSLQNLPRGTEVRDVFIPSEGCVLLSSDFDQIEVRLAAHFAERKLPEHERKMVSAILSGDFHTMTAQYVYGDPSIGKDDPRRSWSKNGIFAKLYGAQPRRFAGTVGISLERAKEVMEGLSTAYPGMQQLMEDVIGTGRKRLAQEGLAWVRTPSGRLQVGDPDKVYALMNYLIQGSAADVLKKALIRLDAGGYGDTMLLPVHDEVLFDIPKHEREQAEHEIPELMNDPDWLVPLTADCASVERWGDKYRKAGAAAPRLVAGDDEA